MITLIDHDNKQVEDEVVIDWCKDSVCEHLGITRNDLNNPLRKEKYAYARKLFWYFGFCKYGISSKKLSVLKLHDFGESSVRIQAQTIMLQKHYNKELNYDIGEVEKLLKKREELT